MTNISRDKKKSDFVALDAIPDTTTFDFVYNGQNYKITKANMIAEFGTTGSISQKGDPTQTPILNIDGTDNQIRNLEDGSGVKASISPLGGALLEHNFQQDGTGAEVLKDITADSPIFRSLVAGSGISVAEQNGFIQIALSSTPVTTKTVIINEESDFPTPVSGVITLEGDKSYFLTNDISTANRFVLGSNTVVQGTDGTLISLTYTGSGTMFTSVDNSNKIKDMIINCTSGTFIDVSCSIGVNLFQVLNSNISCDKIGSVDGIAVVLFDTIAWSVTTDGVSFANNIQLIAFAQNIGSLSAGTFADLGSCTFDGFSFSNSQGMIAAGATFISGLTGSANVNTGGLATVFNTRASGSGTPLNGVTLKDSLWEFFGNNGIPNSKNSLLATHGSSTITISAANTPVIIDNTWSFESESRFSGNANGVFTYTGKGAYVILNATVTADLATGIDDCTFYFYKNGVQESGSAVQREFDAGDPGNISMVWQMDLETNDTISIYVENNDTSVNIDIVNAILGIS